MVAVFANVGIIDGQACDLIGTVTNIVGPVNLGSVTFNQSSTAAPYAGPGAGFIFDSDLPAGANTDVTVHWELVLTGTTTPCTLTNFSIRVSDIDSRQDDGTTDVYKLEGSSILLSSLTAYGISFPTIETLTNTGTDLIVLGIPQDNSVLDNNFDSFSYFFNTILLSSFDLHYTQLNTTAVLRVGVPTQQTISSSFNQYAPVLCSPL